MASDTFDNSDRGASQREIAIPDFAMVVLIGVSSSGKSTFAKRHFRATEILSSDVFRGVVLDDENSQAATQDAFEILHYVLAKRLKNRRLTVIDATNLEPESRKKLIAIAREYHCLSVAIVFDVPERVCQDRNNSREDRRLGPHVLRRQRGLLRQSQNKLKWEGFRQVEWLKSERETESLAVVRRPLWCDRRKESGPFDIIGDIHGCANELESLLCKLGYVKELYTDKAHVLQDPQCNESEISTVWGDCTFRHPEGRRAIFLGDLIDRGPSSLGVLRIVRNMVVTHQALCVLGNHDDKLSKKLRGKDVKLSHGLAQTCEEIDSAVAIFGSQLKDEILGFLDGLVTHYVLDEGRLLVAHAGLKESLHGRASGEVRAFALFGDTTGTVDEFGLPERLNWAADYRGSALVVYGHTPVSQAVWQNRTINIDTGCVFGGQLTALRYPERELVSAEALQTYCESAKPIRLCENTVDSAEQGPSHAQDMVLDLRDVLCKRQIEIPSLRMKVSIHENNAMAALEAMSRFAADPRWIIYLPPTMSPCATSNYNEFLEYPTEAFDDFRKMGVQSVICEEKHMGSRAVVIVTRSADVARIRFGIDSDCQGMILSRRGRAFFDDAEHQSTILNALRNSITKANLWDELATDWLCLDCELMPWSAKAVELLKNQYAAVAAAGMQSLPRVIKDLELAFAGDACEGKDVLENFLKQTKEHAVAVERFRDAYRRYCWPVDNPFDYRLAPFHILAGESGLYVDRNHLWHMTMAERLCEHDSSGILKKTPYRVVNLQSSDEVSAATKWWEDLTAQGGEGMVVKPLEFIVHGKQGMVQPAIKVRGPEYLRIIYGPDYMRPDSLARLRKRGLKRKRTLAIREFALGIEGLTRFVNRDALRRVHECAFGVLAIESEPVDPRL